MKRLVLSLTVAVCVVACGDNTRWETSIRTDADPPSGQATTTLSTTAESGLQAGTINTVFRYSDQAVGPYGFHARFIPARAFAGVSDEVIIAAFAQTAHITYTSDGVRLTMRDHSSLEACKDFEATLDHIPGHQLRFALDTPYPASFVLKWNFMRFGSNVFFGPVTGILTRGETPQIIGFIEQAYPYWSGPTPRIMVSSAGDAEQVRAKTIDLAAPKTPKNWGASDGSTFLQAHAQTRCREHI